MIARTHNHAGFPGGISGQDLLGRMREQALAFGAEVTEGLAESLSKEGELFVARVGDLVFRARSVLLATGMVNNSPRIAAEIHGAGFAGAQ